MNALASDEEQTEWKLVTTKSRGRHPYENIVGTTVSKFDFSQINEAPPAGFGFLDELIDSLEADLDFSDDLAAARREMGSIRLTEIGLSLAALRLAQGMSQTDLAKSIDTSQAAISRLEAGMQEPRLSMLRKLAAALKVDLNTLNLAIPE